MTLPTRLRELAQAYLKPSCNTTTIHQELIWRKNGELLEESASQLDAQQKEIEQLQEQVKAEQDMRMGFLHQVSLDTEEITTLTVRLALLEGALRELLGIIQDGIVNQMDEEGTFDNMQDAHRFSYAMQKAQEALRPTERGGKV